MGMMKHKHTCLIMAMMLYSNTNKNVLTNMPKEVLEHIVGFIAGHQGGPACNVFGLRAEEPALFLCDWCKVPKPLALLYHDMVDDRDDELETNVAPASCYYF